MKTTCNNCQLENVESKDIIECAVCQTPICSDCYELDEANAPNCPLCLDCYSASPEAIIFLKALERSKLTLQVAIRQAQTVFELSRKKIASLEG